MHSFTKSYLSHTHTQIKLQDWQTVDKLDLRKLLMSHLRKNVEEIALECGQYGVPWKTDAERELAVEIGHYLVNRGYVPQVSAMYIRYKRTKDAAVKAAAEAESKRNKYGGGGKSKRRRGTKQKKVRVCRVVVCVWNVCACFCV